MSSSSVTHAPPVPSPYVYLPWFPFGFVFEKQSVANFCYRGLNHACSMRGTHVVEFGALAFDRMIAPAKPPRTPEALESSMRSALAQFRVLGPETRVICVLQLRGSVDVPGSSATWSSFEWMLERLQQLGAEHAKDMAARGKGKPRFCTDAHHGRHVLLFDEAPEYFDLVLAPYGGTVGPFGEGGQLLTSIGQWFTLALSREHLMLRQERLLKREDMVNFLIWKRIGVWLRAFLHPDHASVSVPIRRPTPYGTIIRSPSLFPQPKSSSPANELRDEVDFDQEETKTFPRPSCAAHLPLPRVPTPAPMASRMPLVGRQQGSDRLPMPPVPTPTIKMKACELPDARGSGSFSAQPDPEQDASSTIPPPEQSGTRLIRRVQVDDHKTSPEVPLESKEKKGV